MPDTPIKFTSKGTVKGGNYKLTLPKSKIPGLVRQFQLQYGAPVQRVYDLFNPEFYFIKGPPQGKLSMERVVGPKEVERFTDLGACPTTGDTITLETPTACTEGAPAKFKYVLKDPIFVGMSATGSSDSFIIGEGLQFEFGEIET